MYTQNGWRLTQRDQTSSIHTHTINPPSLQRCQHRLQRRGPRRVETALPLRPALILAPPVVGRGEERLGLWVVVVFGW